MPTLFFWNNWVKDYRVIWYVLACIFLFSLACLWMHYFNGAANVIGWEKLQEQKTIETTIHTFRVGPFHLTIPAESYVIFEYFSGSDVHHNFFASYSFLIVFAVGLSVLLAITTVLDRFWYFVGLSIFVAIVIIMRLEVLYLFGIRNIAVPAVILIAYLGLSFVFKYLKPTTSFIIRVGSFLGLTTVLGLIIYFFAGVPLPFIHLIVTSYVPALVITIIFALMVAHEILIGFVKITNDPGAGNGAKHFALISAIYLIYVIITALHEMGVVEWDFVYINIYLLLTISTVLGLWAFRLREPQYGDILPVHPFGVIMMLALACIAFITVSQLIGNANDAALKVVRDLIIFSHAGFGIVFFIYFMSNFMAMMVEKLPVYEVLYKPHRMPYFTFQLAGLIATLAFVFYSHWREYIYQASGGYYNYGADLHVLMGNENLGMSYYEQSASRAFANHRANYALATMKTSRLNFEKALDNYESANYKRPTEFSLVNAGNMSLWTKRYFDAIAAFKEGNKAIKKSPYLQNNLGYSYARVHAIDSASMFLSAARDDDKTKASAETNFLAMAAVEYLPIDADSVLKLFETDAPGVMGNAFALSTLFRQKLAVEVDPLKERELNLHTATLLNNYLIHNVKNIDTAFLSRADAIASDTLNYAYNEALRASIANAWYHQGHVAKALSILTQLAFANTEYQGRFNYLMGLWALEQGDPMLAASYFRYAEEADYKEGKFYYAIALTEARDQSSAIRAWDSVAARNDLSTSQLAETMKRILTMPASEVVNLSDPEKYQFCRYRVGLSDSLMFNRILGSIENHNYKGQALVDRTTALIRAGKLIPAINTFNKLTGLQLTDKRLYDDVQFLDLRLLSARKETLPIVQKINAGIKFDESRAMDKLLYTSLLQAQGGDSTKAEQGFNVLATVNPFFEEGVLAAVDFFKSRQPASMKAYNLLVEAIYVNKFSVRLLKAYRAEALRLGYTEYALSADQRIRELEIFYR